jgi:acetyl esterase/lipase
MPYQVDPELAAVLAVIARANGDTPVPERGDWKALRRGGSAGQAYLASLIAPSANVSATSYTATAADGAPIGLRWYAKLGSAAPGSAVVYAHGGGMVMGNLDVYDTLLSLYVTMTGVPFLSVDYRLAPEVTGETLAGDVFTGIGWLAGHAPELGVDPARVAVMGDSGGGGVAAGAAILARNRGVELCRQILVYPMLDDRNVVVDPLLAPFATWTHDNNFTAWAAVLGEGLGADRVSPVAAPARLTDFAGLPPAYVEVGELDIFRDEDVAYGQQLAAAGVPVELHIHPGAPHGFDRFAPNSKLARRAFGDRTRVLESL